MVIISYQFFGNAFDPTNGYLYNFDWKWSV